MEAHLAHNQEHAGSSPVSATLLLFVGRSVSDRELFETQNKLSNKDKAGMSLVCTRHCDCV